MGTPLSPPPSESAPPHSGHLQKRSYLPDKELVDLLRAEFEARWPPDATGAEATARYALVPTGKLLRPLLLLHSAQAVGGSVHQVLPAAVGLECVHVGSLIHDDLIDHDDVRRNRDSVHRRFGADHAIVAGNALFFTWFDTLGECADRGVPAARVLKAMRIQARVGRQVCQGAATELCMAGHFDTPVADYLEMVRLKTAILLAAACRTGSVLVGARSEHAEALTRYGEALGIAFQIRDDLLPYGANPDVAGKPAASDIRNLRPTLPVLLARDLATPAGRVALLQAVTAANPQALDTVREIVHSSGAGARATDLARQYSDLALHQLDALPDSLSKHRLAALAALTDDRTR
ncbi:polyprenyl synthetase family protein [Streptomyces sp. ISL-98]|nr:polyprenyl synthetase family protein [Streptomyces sp. ISL-98]